MKKMNLLLSICFILLLFTSCSRLLDDKLKEENTAKASINTYEVNQNSEDSPELFEWNDTITLPIPKPKSDSVTFLNYGAICYDISAKDVKDYLNYFKENGWKTVYQSKNDNKIPVREYILTKDDMILQLNTYLPDKSGEMNNTLLVKLDQNIKVSGIMSRKKALSKMKALSLIQTSINNLQDTGELNPNSGSATNLIELYIKDAYDKMNLQAFAAFGGNGFIGCFLIVNESVCFVRGQLENTCVADIDSDGNFELLDAFGFGSGIYRTVLSAYQYGNPPWFSSLNKIIYQVHSESYVKNTGYGNLVFEKLDDHTIKLWEAELEDSMTWKKTVDYGVIKPTATSFFQVEDMEHFPYQSMKTLYNQDKLINSEKDIPAEPPEIRITIENDVLDYKVDKLTWNNEDFQPDNPFPEIIKNNTPIPVYNVNGIYSYSTDIIIDFGKYIPDSVKIYDNLLDENGENRFSEKEILERIPKILDDGRISFGLTDHMAILLSSSQEDYKKAHNRGFKIIAAWGENTCEYDFVIQTKNK